MNTTDKKTKTGHFFSGMLYFALAAVLIISLASAFLYVYLAAYEHSRPSFALKKYVESVNMNHVVELSKEVVDQVDKNTQSSQESYEKIYHAIKNGRFIKNVKESNEYELSYILKDNEIMVENVVLTMGKPGVFGFIPWAVKDEHLLESSLFSRVNITVPEGYRVELNGTELGPDSVVNRSVPLKILDGFYEISENLPVYVEYDTGEFIGKADYRVLDQEGNAVSASDYAEEIKYDNCTETEKEAIKELMNEFIEKYVTYKSSANRNAAYNLYEVTPYCVSGSDMEKRLQMALGGLAYASSLGDKVTDITYERFMNVGEGRYACSLTYTVDTIGSNSAHTVHTYSSRFLLKEVNGVLKVEAESTF